MWRATRERPPEFPPQFAPPPGLGPAQIEFIRSKELDEVKYVPILAATLFYLAERGLVALSEPRLGKWAVQGIAGEDEWTGVDPVSRKLGATLKVNTAGRQFTFHRSEGAAGWLFKTAGARMHRSARKWAFGQGLIVRDFSRWLVMAVGFVALPLPIWMFARPRGPVTSTDPFAATMWGLPFAVVFFATTPWWTSGEGIRHTAEGRELWSRAEGFLRVLQSDSADTRVDFARKDIYIEYLPYAVAAGAATAWAQKYKAATGHPVPTPKWYPSSAGNRDGPGHFDSFESVVREALEADVPAG